VKSVGQIATYGGLVGRMPRGKCHGAENGDRRFTLFLIMKRRLH
jgi:hypothetical protein